MGDPQHPDVGPADLPPSLEVLGTVLWRRRGATWLDHCGFRRQFGCPIITGSVVTLLDGQPAAVSYHVTCKPDWSVQDAHARLAHGDDLRQTELVRDFNGEWKNLWHAKLDQIRGLIDVDFGFTPSTNTLAIRRLGLEVGESAMLTVAWVRFPELVIEPMAQRYTRTESNHYRFETADGDFAADIEVDDEGIVVRYGDLWERVEA